MVRAAGLEVAVTRRESGPQVERELRAAHWANNRNRAIRSIPVAVAANTAAANAFPDRGAGGYLGRSLPQVFRSVSVIVSPCWPSDSTSLNGAVPLMESREDCLREAAECDRLPDSRTPKALAPCWPSLRSNGESWQKERPNGKSVPGHWYRKRCVRTSAQAEAGKVPETHQKFDFDSAGQRQRFADTGSFERLF